MRHGASRYAGSIYAGSSGGFVIGSIRRLTKFSFRTKPIIKLRTGFASTSLVKLTGATANGVNSRLIADGPATGNADAVS